MNANQSRALVKGAGAQRICSGNLFDNLPRYASKPDADSEGWATFFLMVDENGAVELSRPVVKQNTFSAYVERIYLSDGSDIGGEAEFDLDEKVIVDNFDPLVARK